MRRTTVMLASLLVLAAAAPALVAADATTGAPAAPAADAANVQGAECSFPGEWTDLTGETVSLEEEPDRVVTLNPSAAQTMHEIGAWDKVVGATKHASNLEGFEDVTNISAAGRTISNEEVVDLEADIVLAPNTIANETVTALRDADQTVYKFREAGSIEAIYEKTRLIGELTGECEGAEGTVSWMQEELNRIDEAVADRERPDAMYVFFGYTSGEGTFIGSLIERAGANNAAAEAGIQSYQEVNQEIIVSADPDWFVFNSDDPGIPDAPGYDTTTAAEQNQTVTVNTNHLNRPGPRVVYAVSTMAEAFHSEAYEGAQAPDNSGASGPGFGVAAGVAAVAILALLGRRE